MEGCGGGALEAAGGVAAALQVGERDVLDGAVALDGARDAFDASGVGVLVGLVEGVVFAADGGVGDVAVGCGCGSKGEGG